MAVTQTISTRRRSFALALLTLVYGFNFVDRQILGILAPYIKADLDISSTQLGLLGGLGFAIFYTLVAIPIAWLADRYNRVNILSISLATWSGFTALTGLATNFTQIALARAGVGVGEAGGSPPSHSIISDMYAKHERASALGVYSMGIPFGVMAAYLITGVLLGQSDGDVDWRRIFIILGLLGIVLSLILKITLPEPVRGAMDTDDMETVEKAPFMASLKTLLTIPSWWYMCIGIAMGSFVSYALSFFQTTYIKIFDPNVDMRMVIIILGVMHGVSYAGGTFVGARLADLWGKKTLRAYGLLPAIAILLAAPLAVISYWVPSITVHLVCGTLMLFFLGAYLGPSFAIAQTLAPINMRAMSTALFFFILNMIALGGGPTIAGYLIDVFGQTNNELMSIRLAISAVCVAFIFSILSFLMVSKTIVKDWAAAEERNEAQS